MLQKIYENDLSFKNILLIGGLNATITDSNLDVNACYYAGKSNLKYNKQRNLCASLLEAAKKKYYTDLKAFVINKKVLERFRAFLC